MNWTNLIQLPKIIILTKIQDQQVIILHFTYNINFKLVFKIEKKNNKISELDDFDTSLSEIIKNTSPIIKKNTLGNDTKIPKK